MAGGGVAGGASSTGYGAPTSTYQQNSSVDSDTFQGAGGVQPFSQTVNQLGMGSQQPGMVIQDPNYNPQVQQPPMQSKPDFGNQQPADLGMNFRPQVQQLPMQPGGMFRQPNPYAIDQMPMQSKPGVGYQQPDDLGMNFRPQVQQQPMQPQQGGGFGRVPSNISQPRRWNQPADLGMPLPRQDGQVRQLPRQNPSQGIAGLSQQIRNRRMMQR